PEDLLLRGAQVVRRRCDHRRRVERAGPVRYLAAGSDLRALAARTLDEAVHLLAVRGRDERAHLRLGIERVADAHAFREVGDLRDDVVVDALLDEQPRARLARLAGRVVD